MKVYVVLSGYDYESSRIEAVFDDANKANSYAEDRRDGSVERDYGFDWIEYEEWDVK